MTSVSTSRIEGHLHIREISDDVPSLAAVYLALAVLPFTPISFTFRHSLHALGQLEMRHNKF